MTADIRTHHPFLKCGHTARGTDQNGKPVCPVCIGMDKGAEVIDENPPDLTGRVALCSACHKNEKPSSFDLAFFEYAGPGTRYERRCSHCGWMDHLHPSHGGTGNYYRSDKRLPGLCEDHGETYAPTLNGLPHDYYYCGCQGWE